jgi:hypothetical protein
MGRPWTASLLPRHDGIEVERGVVEGIFSSMTEQRGRWMTPFNLQILRYYIESCSVACYNHNLFFIYIYMLCL